MSSNTRRAVLRYGKHTSSSQLEIDTSVSYGFCEPEGDITHKANRRKVPRDLRRPDNEDYARIQQGNEPPTLGFSTLLRGLNSNSGGAVTTAKQTELAPLFDCIFGANGTGGTASTAVLSGSGATTLVVASAASIAAGNAILFQDSTDGWIVREVVSKSSNTLTLDRAYTGTPVDSGQCYLAVSWYPANDVPDHVHLAADLEFFGLERIKMFGLMGGFTVDFPANGGLSMCSFSFDGTDFDDTQGPASPTFSAPTVGASVPCIDGSFFIGATEYLLRNAKLAVEVTKAQRQHYNGNNGFAGYAVSKMKVALDGTLLMGSGTGEATSANRRTLQSDTAQDIAFQLGRAPGQTLYLRMPAADFDASKGTVDGQDVINFKAMTSRSANQANVPGAARLHLF